MDDRAWRRRLAAGEVVPAGLVERTLHLPDVREEVVARVWAELAARSLPPPAPVLAGRMVDTMLAERLAAHEHVA